MAPSTGQLVGCVWGRPLEMARMLRNPIFLFRLFGQAAGPWKSSGQGLNPCHSSDLSHSRGNWIQATWEFKEFNFSLFLMNWRVRKENCVTIIRASSWKLVAKLPAFH